MTPMTIGQLKTYFETTEHPLFFLTDVFSWRGIYAEVAFTPSKEGMKEESLELIHRALNETFIGYKGGNYTHNTGTDVHFEIDECDFQDDALKDILGSKYTKIYREIISL